MRKWVWKQTRLTSSSVSSSPPIVLFLFSLKYFLLSDMLIAFILSQTTFYADAAFKYCCHALPWTHSSLFWLYISCYARKNYTSVTIVMAKWLQTSSLSVTGQRWHPSARSERAVPCVLNKLVPTQQKELIWLIAIIHFHFHFFCY